MNGYPMHKNQYSHLLVMTVLSYFAMFILMYVMVDRFSNIYPNVNQAYMAGLMTAPMVIIELVVMRAMYPSVKLNVAIVGVALLVLVLSFMGIRMQTAVGDTQFVKSMIPHHSGAILMCNQANLTDLELKKLCREIVQGQQQEIDQMKSILMRLTK